MNLGGQLSAGVHQGQRQVLWVVVAVVRAALLWVVVGVVRAALLWVVVGVVRASVQFMPPLPA
jgi:hypothetical protein